jgi:hypothetical protein
MNVKNLHIHIVTYMLIIEIVCVLLDSKIKKTCVLGFLEYVANAHDSWFLMKGAPQELAQILALSMEDQQQCDEIASRE